MNRLNIFLVVLSLALVAVTTWLLADQPTSSAPGVVAARAAQEQALADGARARAAAEWASAEQARIGVDRARLDLQAAQASLGAIQTAVSLWVLGPAIAANILAIGGALALVVWLNLRARSLYPNAAGQWPVIVKEGRGWVVVHDPNRALGPATLYRREGQPPFEVRAALPLDAPTLAQVTSQAQAVSLVAAAAQAGPGLNNQTRQIIETFARPRLSAPLPEVRRSTWEPSHVERLLVEAGEVE